MDYKITNIKISLKCDNYCLDTVQTKCKQEKILLKAFNNFVVIKEKFTYIIFKKSCKSSSVDNHINITKVDSFENISEAVQFIRFLQPNISLKHIRIDNITVSHNFKRFIDIDILARTASQTCFVTFNKETFPGLFLKFKNGFGTAIIFYTGKSVLLGSKNLNDIEDILFNLKCMISKHDV